MCYCAVPIESCQEKIMPVFEDSVLFLFLFEDSVLSDLSVGNHFVLLNLQVTTPWISCEIL